MLLKLKVVPKSSKNQLSWYDKAAGILKLNITAPPVDGKANKEVINFLAKLFDVSRSHIQFKSGETSRLKMIEISALPDKINRVLAELDT